MLAEPDVSTLFIETYKRCGHCGISKPIADFSKDRYRPDGLNNKCRKCSKEVWQASSARRYGAKPLNENRDCSQYLGIHIAEKILSNIFENVKRLPLHNHGYDFICNKGYKIDVKSACNIKRSRNSQQWQFDIGRNQTADYFLCIAFEDRKSLEPRHLWLIPGHKINHLKTASIGERTISKWSRWEKPLDKVVSCCNMLKEKNVRMEA